VKFDKEQPLKNALILMPFATVKAFQYPLLALAKILHRNQINVTVIHCQQAMRHGCNAMLAHNLKLNATASEKKKICDNCLSVSKSSVGGFRECWFWSGKSGRR